MSIMQSPDEQRRAIRDATYANSGAEADAIEQDDRAWWDRVHPLAEFDAQQAFALHTEVDEAIDAATTTYVEARAFAERIRSGEVELDAFTARDAERYRSELLRSAAALSPLVGRLEHSIKRTSDPWAAYCALVTKYPQLKRN